jgi:putative hydrolase of the HAD superfamily
MLHYENIIFDLGGVIIDLHLDRTHQLFTALSGKDFYQLFSLQSQAFLFDAFETGQISDEEFRNGLRMLLQVDLPDEVIDAHWNALLGNIPAERLQLLLQLGQQKRIFLLSNTNSIHKKAFEEILFRQHGYAGMEVFFEKAYYSHEVGDRKPNTSIFTRVLEENGLEPAKTLFIDDTLKHVEGARKAGLHAYHLQAPVTINTLFNG